MAGKHSGHRETRTLHPQRHTGEAPGLGSTSRQKKTDYLIVGEKAGSKLTKAMQFGIKALTEEEFESVLTE